VLLLLLVYLLLSLQHELTNGLLLQESYHSIGIKVFWLDNSEPWRPPPDAYFGKPGATGSSGTAHKHPRRLFPAPPPLPPRCLLLAAVQCVSKLC